MRHCPLLGPTLAQATCRNDVATARRNPQRQHRQLSPEKLVPRRYHPVHMPAESDIADLVAIKQLAQAPLLKVTIQSA